MKKKPKLKPPTPTQRLRIANDRIAALRKELYFTNKSRKALAASVNPVALARLYVLTERNRKLEMCMILFRQVVRTLPPCTLLTELENDMDRLLGV